MKEFMFNGKRYAVEPCFAACTSCPHLARIWGVWDCDAPLDVCRRDNQMSHSKVAVLIPNDTKASEG